MKSSGWDNKLWHDKMQELPIPGDENSAWGAMRALLDENMPVETPVVNLPKNPSGTKLISILAAVIIAGILCYTAVRLYPSLRHKLHQDDAQKIKPFNNKYHVADNNPKNTGTNNALTVTKPGKNTADNTSANTTPSGNKNALAEASKNALKTAGNLSNGGKAVKNQGRAANTRATLSGPTLATERSHHTAKTTRLNNRRNNPYFVRNQNGQNLSETQTYTSGNPSSSGHIVTDNNVNGVNDTKNTQLKNADSVAATNQNSNAAKASSDTKNMNSNVADTKKTDSAASVSVVAVTNNKLPGKTPHRRMKRSPQTHQVFKLNNSKFELNVNGGYNANAHPSAFIGIAGAYYIAPKLSLGLDVQILPSKVMTGSYHNSNYEYTTVDGSGGKTTQIADNIVVKSSAKFYSIDVPIIAYYHINKYLSVNAGPVIVFPVYNDDLKNTLGPLTKPADTLSAYRSIVSGANHTIISTKIGVNLSGGLRVSINRYFLDANYVQGLSPYTISSSLGSDKVYFHTLQFGIGYYIYRPLPKSKVKH